MEYAIPKPLPFLRIGLSNIPIILSIYLMRRRDTLLLILLKILAQGILTGTLFSYIFLFSAGGSFASGLTMLTLYPLLKNHISAVGLSLAGALANTLIQILLAQYIVFGAAVRYIAPILLISGLVTGFLLGIFTERFMQKSLWFSSFSTTKPEEAC